MIKAVGILSAIGVIAIIIGAFLQGLEASFHAWSIFYTIGAINFAIVVIIWLIWDDRE